MRHREDIDVQVSEHVSDHASLLEIAAVLDAIIATRNALYAPFTPPDDTELRRALFALLDQPSQARWVETCNTEVVPRYIMGLDRPSPLGITLADVVYAFGLPDITCPSQTGLLEALSWACREYGRAPNRP